MNYIHVTRSITKDDDIVKPYTQKECHVAIPDIHKIPITSINSRIVRFSIKLLLFFSFLLMVTGCLYKMNELDQCIHQSINK